MANDSGPTLFGRMAETTAHYHEPSSPMYCGASATIIIAYYAGWPPR